MRPKKTFVIHPDPEVPEQSIMGWHVTPRYASDFAEVLQVLEAGDVVVFAGAGVSIARPSNAPDWNALAKEIAAAALVEAQRRGFVEPSVLRDLQGHLQSSQPRPESLMAEISGSLTYGGDDPNLAICRFLSSPLAGGQFNAVHLTLAAALAFSRVRAIVTTNLDTYFEDALTSLGASHVSVISSQEQVTERTEQADPLPPLVVKLHGSLDDEQSIRLTLYETGVPLRDWRADLTARILQRKHVLFLGYSGNDVDVSAFLYDNLASTRGFTWLVRDCGANRMSDRIICRHADIGSGICGDLYKLIRSYSERLVPHLDRRVGRLIEESWSRTTAQGEPRYSSVRSWMERVPDPVMAVLSGHIVAEVGPASAATALLDNIGGKMPARAAGNLRNRLSEHYRKAWEIDKSAMHAKAAVTIGKQLSNRRILGDGYNNLGIAYHVMGDLDEALACFKRSLKEREADGDPWRAAVSKMNIALVYLVRKDVDRALSLYQEVLPILMIVGDQHNVAATVANIGQCFLEKRCISEAVRYFRAALAYLEIGRDVSATYTVTLRIAACEKIAGNILAYLEAMEYADSLVEELPTKVRQIHADFHRALKAGPIASSD
jgi:tetratricopeptide (TPR) repeat protein